MSHSNELPFLPPEIWQTIICHLRDAETKDVQACRLVNCLFRRLVDKRTGLWDRKDGCGRSLPVPDLCLLIMENVDDKNPADSKGRTALHFAATAGQLDICRLIMDREDDKNPADSEEGLTPLHDAAYEGYLDICKQIMENVSEKNPPANDGETPLHIAANISSTLSLTKIPRPLKELHLTN